MENNAAANIEKYFGGLKDPRVERTKEHKLLDILVIAICAIICGANDWEAVAEYGRDNQAWFKTFLALLQRDARVARRNFVPLSATARSPV